MRSPHSSPDLEVRSGGSTSVDITHRGIDKAYGMRQLAEQTGIPLDDMLFVGDRLDPDGNDYPVLAIGVPCHAVEGWEDTAEYLDALLPTLPARQLSQPFGRRGSLLGAGAATGDAAAAAPAVPTGTRRVSWVTCLRLELGERRDAEQLHGALDLAAQDRDRAVDALRARPAIRPYR